MSNQDLLMRFLIDGAAVRGVHVRLDDTWRQIRQRSCAAVPAGQDTDAPPPEALELLGQAAAAAALCTAHVKLDGRLSLQLRGNGDLRLLFAECTAAGTLRGIVQAADPGSIDGGAGDAPPATVATDLHAFGDDALLAITIENRAVGDRDPMRYQSLVTPEAASLAAALEGYFCQSEQLPTRLLLAANDTGAAGLLLQVLPGDRGDDDSWQRVGALLNTLGSSELLDCPAETLLSRLFHEDGVRLLGNKPLRFDCSCSRERVAAMLQALGEDEARAAVSNGMAEIVCEFCGQRYHFDADAIGELLAEPDPPTPPPSTRLQ